MKKLLASILAICLVLSTMSFVVLADDADTDVYVVGAGMDYETLKEAVAVAQDLDGDGQVTIEIYGKVEIGKEFQINIAVDTVNIVGKTDDAEICVITQKGGDYGDNGNIYVANNSIETVNFSDLILCRHNGGWRGNEGQSTHFFTVWDSDGSTDLITYTNCVFPEGASNNQYGKTTYTGCTFNKDNYYGLWIYGSGSSATVEVTGCDFVADRGLKVYSEDDSAFVNTKVENSTFDIASKPAIVSSIAGNLVINEVDATACEYGLLASEPKEGRSDLAPATVVVDGKTPAYVAKVGNMVCTDMDYAEAEKSDTKPIEPVVAMIGTTFYTSFADALAAAVGNDTITLLTDVSITEKTGFNKENLVIDLNNNTMNMTAELSKELVSNDYGNSAYAFTKSTTFKNGTMNVSNVNKLTNDHGVFYTRYVALTFDNIDFISDGYNANAMFNVTGTLNFINGTTVNVKNNAGGSSFIDANHTNVNIINSTINLDNTVRGMMNVNLNADNSDITITNLTDNALRNVKGTINNTKISANGYASGLKNDSGNALAVTGTSELKFTGATGEGEYDIYMKNGATLNVADTASVYAEKTLFEADDAVTGDVISKADSVSVEFALNEEDSNADDGYVVYDIKVIGANSEVINRLNTADLTFELSKSKIGYEITPADKITLTTDASYPDRYMFNFNGKDDVVDTANEIVIGQVKFTGYDSFTFGVKDVDENLVTATTIRDNIVDEFKGDALIINNDTVPGDENIGSIDTTIAVPTRTLTVNVDFPNVVVKKNDMTVTISGGDLDEDINVDLIDECPVVIEDELTLNTSYTVTVKGAGYRTARYTVTMTGDKTLNFWNNVKDGKVVVEEGEDGSATTKNFLAGDIVADNVINIYDLSAAVSYFTESVSVNPDYVKYDLNRDDVIDSKDVAYILASWGE